MSEREWRPGDVQVVLSLHPSRVQEFGAWLHWRTVQDSFGRMIAAQILKQGHGARLVVIDPEDHEQVERFSGVYLAAIRDNMPADNPTHMQAALREFANPAPPKPDEPIKGLKPTPLHERKR